MGGSAQKRLKLSIANEQLSIKCSIFALRLNEVFHIFNN
jgi:hypothetical protein